MLLNPRISFTYLFLASIFISGCGGAKTNNTVQNLTLETNIIASASYGNTSCAVKTKESNMKGILTCWGDNYLGAVGDPTHYNTIDFTTTANRDATRFIPVTTPFNVNTANTPVAQKTIWKQVSVHDENVCAIKNDGTLWCWGDNEFGDNGIGTNVISTAPVQEATKSRNWVRVSNGDNHTCGLQSDPNKAGFSLWCWGGRSFERQIGDPQLVKFQPTLIM